MRGLPVWRNFPTLLSIFTCLPDPLWVATGLLMNAYTVSLGLASWKWRSEDQIVVESPKRPREINAINCEIEATERAHMASISAALAISRSPFFSNPRVPLSSPPRFKVSSLSSWRQIRINSNCKWWFFPAFIFVESPSRELLQVLLGSFAWVRFWQSAKGFFFFGHFCKQLVCRAWWLGLDRDWLSDLRKADGFWSFLCCWPGELQRCSQQWLLLCLWY